MKRTLLLAGATVAIVAVGAYAHADDRRERREVRIEEHIERIGRIDANADGFVTRAEAQAEAERAFGDLDSDDNNKIDSADRGAHPRMYVHRMGGRKGGDRDVRVIVRDGEKDAPTVIERSEVRIHEGGRRDGARPPRPPRAPMSMMLLMNSDEADRNGDGALSKEEFVAQQLRFFDASDANGDGKVKFERPPAPPEAPEPPKPPQPPRR